MTAPFLIGTVGDLKTWISEVSAEKFTLAPGTTGITSWNTELVVVENNTGIPAATTTTTTTISWSMRCPWSIPPATARPKIPRPARGRAVPTPSARAGNTPLRSLLDYYDANGGETVKFNIPPEDPGSDGGTGVFTIHSNGLPAITQPITVDG